jgi:hypothetical protein
MREYRCDGEASRTFYIHEERVRLLHESLELVLLLLVLGRRVKEIDGESHGGLVRWSCR